jgi:alpha-glucoside transport system permease protein
MRKPGIRRSARAGVYVALTIIAALWLIPTLGLFITSFRHLDAINGSGWWNVLLHPGGANLTLDNYAAVTGAQQTSATAGVDLLGNLVNSFTVTIPATVIPIFIAALAAYGFAWLRFRGRAIMFVVVIALLVVPLQIALIPVLRLYVKGGVAGTFVGIWFAHTAFGLPLAIYIMYTYISAMPRDMFESAFLDGADHFAVFTRLVLPLSVPALASFAIFQFLWVWNDLLVALVFLGSTSKVAVLTVALLNMVGTYGTDWQLLTAGAFISMIFPMVVFFALQRYFIRGLLAGSIKG